MADVPLRSNRDFSLLQAGQLLSNLGTQSTAIAYPLLVLALTGSATNAGTVGFARGLPLALLLIPAGIAADRYSRKRMMIVADVVRALAVGGLVLAIAADQTPFWLIVVVALVEGSGAAAFMAARPGAVRAVVPPQQLPAAAGAQTGLDGAIQLAGPPLGGALFGLGRALPFLADVVSYTASTVSLLAMRTPFQELREGDDAPLRRRLTEGFRFLWSRPFIRTTGLLFSLGNFIGPGLVLVVVVVGRRQGLSPAEIGALTATFGACLLVGSFMSSAVRRALTVRAIIMLELWTGIGCAIFLVRPSVYVLVAGMAPSILMIPSTNSVVHGYRIAMTPDRLLGRSESVRSTLSLAIAPLGPLIAGVLLSQSSPRLTVAVFSALSLVLALWGSLSPAVRRAPSLAD
ncbi:MAG: MFS transporter [Actinomycetota bacterium]